MYNAYFIFLPYKEHLELEETVGYILHHREVYVQHIDVSQSPRRCGRRWQYLQEMKGLNSYTFPF